MTGEPDNRAPFGRILKVASHLEAGDVLAGPLTGRPWRVVRDVGSVAAGVLLIDAVAYSGEVVYRPLEVPTSAIVEVLEVLEGGGEVV